MGSLGIDGSSSRGKSYFDGPLYEFKELFLLKGEEHSVTLDESDGVSESDKSTITNALLSQDKGSQASKIKASRNNKISASDLILKLAIFTAFQK
ncbi:hypothetical protein PGT21_030492 [Puccinia graminis f. sp. tritici]|nr:hypothetical protein PGT21_030492 [Puccinia graminis f. sp. tritici]